MNDNDRPRPNKQEIAPDVSNRAWDAARSIAYGVSRNEGVCITLGTVGLIAKFLAKEFAELRASVEDTASEPVGIEIGSRVRVVDPYSHRRNEVGVLIGVLRAADRPLKVLFQDTPHPAYFTPADLEVER
jgi:hypothetical protein